MPKQRKRRPKALPQNDLQSFGSGLDDVGWKPASTSIRLKFRGRIHSCVRNKSKFSELDESENIKQPETLNIGPGNIGLPLRC